MRFACNEFGQAIMQPQTPGIMQSTDVPDVAIANMVATFNASPASSSPRRQTVSNIAQPRLRATNIQCTHHTVTRLYTQEFRCSSCLRVAPLGWLYRCVQDRELMLYEDMELGHEGRFDSLPDLYKLPATPPKRHPIARLDRLSFLDEITEEQRKTYSSEQIDLILKQRAKVLDTAFQSSRNSYTLPTNSFQNIPLTPIKGSSTNVASQSTPLPRTPLKESPTSVASPSPENIRDRPWFPMKGGECQFKCCQYCRNLVERSFLSLGGIADGDVPPSAILGFGFHLDRKRPVALVKHVKNLGLRPNPTPRISKPATPVSDMNYRKMPPTPNRLSRMFNRRNTMQGLGLFSSTVPTSSMIAEPTEATSTNLHAHGHAHSVEQGFTAVPLDNLPTPHLSSRNPYLFNQALIHSPAIEDLRSQFQHPNPSDELTKPEVKQETTDAVLASDNQLDVETIVRRGLSAGVSENEKEALLEMDLKEKDELTPVVGVEAVEPGMDISDVITQF